MNYKYLILVTFQLLLTGCLGSSPEGQGTYSSDLPNPSQTLSTQAVNIITLRCQSCHGESSVGFGGIKYINNYSALISNNLVVPFDLNNSRLYQVILNNSMPLSGGIPSGEKEVLRKWIAEGALPPGESANINNVELLRFNEETLQAIYTDIQKLKAGGTNLFGIRYFTMTHVNNGLTSNSVLQQFQPALAKMLNSVSWKPTIVKPVSVSNSQLIVRVDISQFGFNLNSWASLEQKYPFDISVEKGVQRAPANLDSAREDFKVQNLLGLIKVEINSAVPIMRMDWLVHEAGKPQTYHDLLQMPTDILELETSLGINVITSIKALAPIRAGFLKSGVSAYNRVIERHPTAYGSYWKSYDFQSNAGASDIFSRPLGPVFADSTFPTERQFAHAGGEIIFNLPNGLQAYVLTDSGNNRIDVAPTAIVQDTGRDDRVVNNGISCIACHSSGMNRTNDQIHDFIANNFNKFDITTRSAAIALYVPNEKLNIYYDTDTNRFLQALLKLGINGTASEPVGPVFYRYEQSLDLDLAAAELDETRMSLQAKIQQSVQLQPILGPLLQEKGTVTRTLFEQNYSNLYELIK